jgi:hypothetical protein
MGTTYTSERRVSRFNGLYNTDTLKSRGLHVNVSINFSFLRRILLCL